MCLIPSICKASFQLIEGSSKQETSLKSQYKVIIDIVIVVKLPNYFAQYPPVETRLH